MPTAYFSNLATELTATQQTLATATYNAVFAYSAETRAQATTEAHQLNTHLETLLTDAAAAAQQMTDFMTGTHAVTPLKAASDLVRHLERTGRRGGATTSPAMASGGAPKICLGSACPGGATCCGRVSGVSGALAATL